MPFFRARRGKGIWLVAQAEPRHLLNSVSSAVVDGVPRSLMLDLERGTSREVTPRDAYPRPRLGPLPSTGLLFDRDEIDAATGVSRRFSV
jgi:hypothetical protein